MKTRRTSSTLYLNLIWHQHQPSYLDAEREQLVAPWVRSHGTKDYFPMAALLQEFPGVHCTINLTPTLLLQLQDYYVRRLKGIGEKKLRIGEKNPFSEQMGSRIDPWLELTLRDTGTLNQEDLHHLLNHDWNAFSVSDATLARFPEYKDLKEKWRGAAETLTAADVRLAKFWFHLSQFDPSFLESNVVLPNGRSVDLRRFVQKDPNGSFRLRKQITERDCRQLVKEISKVLSSIVPVHRQLMYRGRPRGREKYAGQVELSTTPFYHPILPLLLNSNVAEVAQPGSPLPSRYRSPQTAKLQVKSAIEYHKTLFGAAPLGMWPAEGALSQEVLPILAGAGIKWTATDEKILLRSKPAGLSKYSPCVVRWGDHPTEEITVFFRDTELSDRIGFVYKDYRPKEAADDFIETLLARKGQEEEGDRVVTVALDGENAWEWYRFDPEGRGFLRNLYESLSRLFHERKVITTTPIEFLQGNADRGIPPHPSRSLPVIDELWPGSWINANFDTWIGTPRKNLAWEFLLTARADLERSRIPAPKSLSKRPRKATRAWYAHRAWEELLAAEGSDWFWWMGSERGQDEELSPMARMFLTHLKSVYHFAAQAGSSIVPPDFESRLKAEQAVHSAIGTMKKNAPEEVMVRFQCDARSVAVPDAIYIVGSHPSLGDWVPNKVRMFDDGTHGDQRAGDGIWTIEIPFPVEAEIAYKFTNSGRLGDWQGGDELPGTERRIIVHPNRGNGLILLDVFGVL